MSRSYQDAKRFRVSSNKRTASLLSLFGGFIAILLIENAVTDIDENLIPCLIIAAAAGLFFALLCIVLVKEYYMQILPDGFELIKGSKTTKYAFTAFAGSHVTRHYMNGIYTGTSREIGIRDASGKTIKINANNLSKSSFAELVTYLGQTSYTQSHDVEATAEYFKQGHEFRIPAEKIIKANKNKMILRNGIAIGLLVVFLGMLAYYFAAHIDSAGFFTIMIFAGLGGAIEFFMEGIPAILLYRKIKNLPERIYVDEYSLTIGEQTLNSGSVLNSLMVPGDYDILSRDMTVITKDNTKYKFNFGKKDVKGKLTFKDYDKLCSTIELWCIVNKINFMHILG